MSNETKGIVGNFHVLTDKGFMLIEDVIKQGPKIMLSERIPGTPGMADVITFSNDYNIIRSTTKSYKTIRGDGIHLNLTDPFVLGFDSYIEHKVPVKDIQDFIKGPDANASYYSNKLPNTKGISKGRSLDNKDILAILFKFFSSDLEVTTEQTNFIVRFNNPHIASKILPVSNWVNNHNLGTVTMNYFIDSKTRDRYEFIFVLNNDFIKSLKDHTPYTTKFKEQWLREYAECLLWFTTNYEHDITRNPYVRNIYIETDNSELADELQSILFLLGIITKLDYRVIDCNDLFTDFNYRYILESNSKFNRCFDHVYACSLKVLKHNLKDKVRNVYTFTSKLRANMVIRTEGVVTVLPLLSDGIW